MDEIMAGVKSIGVEDGGITNAIPRAFYGEAIRLLHEQGAAAVGLYFVVDIAHTNLISWLKLEPPASFGQLSDTIFAKELAKAGNVVLSGEWLESRSLESRKWVMPFESFATNAWGIGFVRHKHAKAPRNPSKPTGPSFWRVLVIASGLLPGAE